MQCLISNRFLCNVYNCCRRVISFVNSKPFVLMSSSSTLMKLGLLLLGPTPPPPPPRRGSIETLIPFLSRAIVNDRNLCSLSEIDDDLLPSGSQNDDDDDDDENKLEFLLSRFQRCNGSEEEEPTTPYLLNRVVSTCAKLASLSLGKQTHSAIIKLGFNSNVFIGSSLVDMYSKCGMILKARQLFDEMPEKNVVTWNSLISGYFHSHLSDFAIDLFTEMLKVGIFPTHFTLSAVLVSCSQLNAGGFGVQVHGLCLKTGSCSNIVVGTALIDMYSKCSSTGESRHVFDEMPERNLITWTSMVSGYAQNRQPDEALMLVREMRRMGIKLNKVTYNSLLSSFSSPDYLDLGKQVHCQVIREGLESDMYLVVTLLTMYSDCGNMEDFCKICRAISTYDQITWNSIIAGFSHLGNGEEALDCFTRMRRAYISIDFFTFTNVLRAIGILSALDEGKQTHALVLKSGYASNVFVQNGLVSMYARCGAIVDSIQVFSLISEPDLVSWNSLLSGCAQHGYGMEAVDLFEKMRTLGVKPDHTTFLSVLSACSHVGLLDRGIEYFNLMTGEDSIEQPRLEHYACMVDLLGRAGCLNEAESFISNMPLMPGPSVYKALLSACRVHGNLDIAIRSAKQLLELCPSDPATYVLLSSILAEGGHWIDAADVRKLMCERGVRKNPGCSWVDVNKYYVSVIGT